MDDSGQYSYNGADGTDVRRAVHLPLSSDNSAKIYAFKRNLTRAVTALLLAVILNITKNTADYLGAVSTKIKGAFQGKLLPPWTSG